MRHENGVSARDIWHAVVYMPSLVLYTSIERLDVDWNDKDKPSMFAVISTLTSLSRTVLISYIPLFRLRNTGVFEIVINH